MLKKLTTTLAGIVLSAAAMTSHASLDGMKVVLVHGFQAEDLNNSNRSQKASEYGSYENYMKHRASNVYWSGPWQSKADATIWWDSKERITGGIATDVKNQLKALSNNSNFKGKPILLVTHSTGDLVARHALKRLSSWGISSNNLKVLAVMDFAGAGGGTEIADIANDIANGSGIVNSIQKAAINAFMGFTPSAGNLGVLTDLRPSNARGIDSGSSAYPRFRFTGTGWSNGGLTKPFLRGMDDSVVPMHSACMAASIESIDSCSNGIANNGVIKSVNGPNNGVWSNYYPILMGEKTNHGGTIGGQTGSQIATVNSSNSNLRFATTTKRYWWSWGKKVRWIKSGSGKKMSDMVISATNY
jgi:pimeloyl-ACP methyl ester carboxylesterase